MKIPDDDTVRSEFQFTAEGGVDEGEEKPCDRCRKALKIGDRVFGWTRKKASLTTPSPITLEVCSACHADYGA
jgi:hypothetical protein